MKKNPAKKKKKKLPDTAMLVREMREDRAARLRIGINDGKKSLVKNPIRAEVVYKWTNEMLPSLSITDYMQEASTYTNHIWTQKVMVSESLTGLVIVEGIFKEK